MSRILYLKQCSAELTNLLSNLLWAHASEHMTSNQVFKLNHMDDILRQRTKITERTRVSVIRETMTCLLMPNARINISLWTYSDQEPEILKLCLIVLFIHYVDRHKQLTRVDATCMHQIKQFIASKCSLEIWLCSYNDWLNKALRSNHSWICLRTVIRILWDF